MTMSPILRLQAIIYVKMVLFIVLYNVFGPATHARDLELLRMLVRNRRVLTEYDASVSDRCSLLQERQREQKFRLRAQALSISNCNGIIIPPDTDKSVCENDVAIFSYSIPKNIDMISDYNVFAHLPTNNQENLRHHYTCALSSRSICDTFKPRDVFVVDNDHACYSRNITDVQPDNYQMKIAVDLTCGEIENCPTLWLDGLPLLHIAHRRYPRCNIC